MIFELNPKEEKKYLQWTKRHTNKVLRVCEHVQHNFSIEFSNSSGIGMTKTVYCSCGIETDITDYDSW